MRVSTLPHVFLSTQPDVYIPDVSKEGRWALLILSRFLLVTKNPEETTAELERYCSDAPTVDDWDDVYAVLEMALGNHCDECRRKWDADADIIQLRAGDGPEFYAEISTNLRKALEESQYCQPEAWKNAFPASLLTPPGNQAAELEQANRFCDSVTGDFVLLLEIVENGRRKIHLRGKGPQYEIIRTNGWALK